MAIKIEYDRICFGDFIFCENADGIVFDGCACATSFTECSLGTQAQGSSFGYAVGGAPTPSPQAVDTTIEKYPFASDAPGTDVGELFVCRTNHGSSSSLVSGYSSGGRASNFTPFDQRTNIIDKFSFAVDGNSTDVGDIGFARRNASGHESTVSGYSSGGLSTPVNNFHNNIEKFPFSSDTNATDVGDMTFPRTVSSSSSTTHGYTTGGWTEGVPPNPMRADFDIIEKFPFASDTNATDVGELTQARSFSRAHSSETFGYNSNGTIYPPTPLGSPVDTIDKYPFSSDTSSSDVAELAPGVPTGATTNSTLAAYFAGPGGTISKFPFAAEGTNVDIAELAVPRTTSSEGNQI